MKQPAAPPQKFFIFIRRFGINVNVCISIHPSVVNIYIHVYSHFYVTNDTFPLDIHACYLLPAAFYTVVYCYISISRKNSAFCESWFWWENGVIGGWQIGLVEDFE